MHTYLAKQICLVSYNLLYGNFVNPNFSQAHFINLRKMKGDDISALNIATENDKKKKSGDS
jgi:hypothetical protein